MTGCAAMVCCGMLSGDRIVGGTLVLGLTGLYDARGVDGMFNSSLFLCKEGEEQQVWLFLGFNLEYASH